MTPRTFRFTVIKLMFVSLVLATSTQAAQKTDAVWLGALGNWNDASKWSTKPDFPNDNGPRSYFAVINSGDVTLNQPITIEQLTLGTFGVPRLRGMNILNVRSHFGLNRGLITGQGGTLNALSRATISGNSNLHGWSLTLSGYTRWSGRLGVGNTSVIANLPGATLDLAAGASCASYAPDTGNPDRFKRTLNNYGTINAQGGLPLDITLNNLGTINVNSGTLVLSGGGTTSGSINLANGTILDFEDSNAPTGISYVFSQTSSISGLGSVKFNVFSDVNIGGLYNVTGTTTIGGGTVSFLSPITNLGSSLVVNGQFTHCDLGSNSLTISNLNLRNGTITGSGIVTVDGPLEWNAGSMRGPGVTNAQNGVFFNKVTASGGFDFLDHTLNCYGNSSVQTTAPHFWDLRIGLNAALNIMPGASFNGSRFSISGSSTSGSTNGTVTNYGTLVIDQPGTGMSVSGTAFVNQGDIQVANAVLDVRSSGSQPSFVQNAGSLQLANGNLACDRSTINGGSLSGYGSVGNIVSNGLIAPFGGSLNFFQGYLTLQANSVLSYYLDGTQPGVSFGYLTNASTVTLGGALEIELSEPFQLQIQSSDVFTVLSASESIIGQFTNVVNGGRLTTTDGSGSFVVTYIGNQVVLSDFRSNGFTALSCEGRGERTPAPNCPHLNAYAGSRRRAAPRHRPLVWICPGES